MADLSLEGMRALTVRQPWASLIAAGVKTIETRSWSTSYRGPLAIHAGKQWAKGWLAWMPEDDDRLNLVDSAGGCSHEDSNGSCYYRPWARSLPLGAVVAVADLVDVVPIRPVVCIREFDRVERCVQASDRTAELMDRWGPRGGEIVRSLTDEFAFGDFTPGRYAWLLDNVRPVDPIPAKGRQGLWTLAHPDTQGADRG